jgi:hypothetical protein
VAYALEYVTPFRDDVECMRWLRYPVPRERRRRIEVFAELRGRVEWSRDNRHLFE